MQQQGCLLALLGLAPCAAHKQSKQKAALAAQPRKDVPMTNQVEDIAKRVVDLKLNDKPRAEIEALVEDLDDETREAVLARAVAIMQAQGEALQRESDRLDSLSRLLLMPGCPAGQAGWDWLLQRGLIEETERGWRVTEKGRPGPRAV